MHRISFALIALAASAAAQTTASFRGAVTDSSGAVVPRAAVTAINEGTGMKRQVVSNESGLYVVPLLPVGTYSLTAESNGFKKKTFTGLEAAKS